MPETLGQKQRRFTGMVAELILWANANGYELSFGDAYRDPRLHGEIGVKQGYGHARSAHKARLAVDLNLFKGGKFLTTDADHAPLHDYWESIGGAKRILGDANHYSLEHEGVR